MPRPRFVRVRLPQTGAHWSCPVGAVELHGLAEHVIDDKPPTERAERPKSNVPKGGRRAAQQQAEESADTPKE